MGHERTEQFLENLEIRDGASYIFINSKQSGALEFQKLWSERKFWEINIKFGWLLKNFVNPRKFCIWDGMSII